MDFARREPVGFVSLVVALIMIGCVFLLPIFMDLDPIKDSLKDKFMPPSGKNIMGTDQLGRDVFARIIYGGRTSVIIGLLTTFIAFTIGVTLGLIAGVRGGTCDIVINQFIDISFAIPSLLLAIAAAAVLRGGILTIVIALSLSGWGSFARISRGAAKQLMTSDYVLASRSLGTTITNIVIRHIIPNSISILIVTCTLKMGSFILGESALSFLGLGINPPEPSWGGMVSNSYSFLRSIPRLSIIPGVMIAILVTSFNLLGDSLRDFYDIKKSI